MEENTKKIKNPNSDNKQYWERFQFVLQINEFVICQRYFKINGFTYDALKSAEFKEVMDDVVNMIKQDLISKSRVYEWCTVTTSPLKLTGFMKDLDKYDEVDKQNILIGTEDCVVVCQNGDVIEKTFVTFPDDIPDPFADKERPNENEFVFKFSFLVDDKVQYERIWDANICQKYVRNGIDLTNSNSLYKDRDPIFLSLNAAIIRNMTSDKPDLVYHIIRHICDTLGSAFVEDGNKYTKRIDYSGHEYLCSTYNKDYISGWRSAVEQKTNEYYGTLYPTQGQINFIDKYL